MEQTTEPELSFDLLVDTFIQAISNVGFIFLPLGTIFIVISLLAAAKRLFYGGYGASWSSVVTPFMFGVFMIFLSTVAPSKDQPEETVTTPIPEQTPEISEAPKQPAEPIVLPEVQNLEVLWLIPLATATFAILYLIVKKVRGDMAATKSEEVEARRVEGAIASRWEAVKTHHRELDRLFLSAETDWDMLFNYPTLQDSSVPKTSAMVRAMMKAGRMDQKQPSTLSEDSDLSRYPYPQAVAAFEQSWHTAYEHAVKVGQSKIPTAERRTIKQIRQMLDLAENTGATTSERDLAYSRAQKLIGTLQSVNIPAKALQEIESHQRLAIES